jgi:transcriptional regulator with XRE-family HTH domain
MTGERVLGEFLRNRRARIGPAELGLSSTGGRRATPGLRRGELASLAGISVEYYTRLEQGRDTHPGPSVLDALARALRLDPTERRHLHDLATGPQTPPSPRSPSAGLVHLLHAVRPHPALVLDDASGVLAANPEGLMLFAGLADWPPERRNLARYVFCHPQSRHTIRSWSAIAAACVADLRTVSSVTADPAVADVVGELRVASAEFADLWRRHDVGRNAGGPRRIGELDLVSEILTARDGLHLLVFRPSS